MRFHLDCPTWGTCPNPLVCFTRRLSHDRSASAGNSSRRNSPSGPKVQSTGPGVLKLIAAKLKDKEANPLGLIGYALVMVRPGSPDMLIGSNTVDKIGRLGLMLDCVHEMYEDIKSDYEKAKSLDELVNLLESGLIFRKDES
jgi:hypothetical protein